MAIIRLKRGLAANLPTAGMTEGEPLIATDRGNLWIPTAATTRIPVVPPVDQLSAIGAIDTTNDLLLIHDASASGQKEKKVSVDDFKSALNLRSVNYSAGMRSGGNFVAGLTHCANSSSNLATVANQVYYIPYFNHLTNPISSMGCIVATLAASQTVALGIYSVGSDGNPATLLGKITTNISTGTTGVKVATLDSPINLPLGWCFVAFVCSSASPQFESLTSGAAQPIYSFLGLSSTSQGHKCLYESISAGWTQVPTNPGGSLTAGDVNTPLVGLVA